MTLDPMTPSIPYRSDLSVTDRNPTLLQVHGVLNAVSWGTLMPMGVIIARYLKVFKGADPAWFYLHVTCQTSAYVVGVAGWATGLKLGDSGGETGYHGAVGAVLFIGGTLQVPYLSPILLFQPLIKLRIYVRAQEKKLLHNEISESGPWVDGMILLN